MQPQHSYENGAKTPDSEFRVLYLCAPDEPGAQAGGREARLGGDLVPGGQAAARPREALHSTGLEFLHRIYGVFLLVAFSIRELLDYSDLGPRQKSHR